MILVGVTFQEGKRPEKTRTRAEQDPNISRADVNFS